MPDRVKEKLVELLNDSFAKQYEKRGLLTAPHTATDLIANGVTVQTEDEQRNTYTVQEIEELQNEAYDLGVDSALHHHFGLSWDDAAGLRKEIKRLQDAARWIPVTERLPEVFVPVLVKYLNYNDGSASPTNVDTAVLLEGDVWYWWEGDLADCDNEVKCTVTHWMPLPEPPKEE